MKVKTFILMLIFIFLSAYLQAQCAMCKAVVEANLESGGTNGAGLNDGILYLMAMPYLALGIIAFAWLRYNKRVKA